MKRFKKIILLLLAFMLLGVSGVAAQSTGAVYANNSAEISWGSLIPSGNLTAFNPYDPSPISHSSWSWAKTTDYWGLPARPSSPADDYQNVDDINSSSTSGSVTASNFAIASGGTTVSIIKAVSEAEASVPRNAFSADAAAQHGQVYELTSSGSFDFSIPYKLASQTLLADAGYAYGYVRAWAWLRLWNGAVYAPIKDLDMEFEELDNFIPFDDFNLTPYIGTLKLSYTGTAGQYFLLEAGVDARSFVQKAVVPIPGAVWLLASGLLGLVGIRRFRN